MVTSRQLQRGDTLIEVLMSIVILSMVIVGAISLMARGLASAQIAVEHTQVRLAINSQTELLRYLRDGYIKDPSSQAGQQWSALVASPTYVNTNPSVDDPSTCTVTLGKTAFYVDQSGTGQVTIQPFDQTQIPNAAAEPGKGLWIEATPAPSGITPGYVDFQLRACWNGGASDATQQSITAVRLYDPTP